MTSLKEDEEATRNQSAECARSVVISRDHPAAVAWSTIVVVLLLYVGTIFLYRFCFLEFHAGESGIESIEAGLGWRVIDHIVDVFFWLDLFINFFLAFEDSKGEEVRDFWLGAKRYLRGMFWLNLFACLPAEAFSPIFTLAFSESGSNSQQHDPSVIRVVRMARLARLARLTRLVKLVGFNSWIPGLDWFGSLRGVRVTKFMFGLMWSSHGLACGWYLIAALHTDIKATWLGQREVEVNGVKQTVLQQSPIQQWLVSMYFVLTVFTTVGFGDISANTDAEIVYVVITMCVGVVVYSIIISEVIQVVTSTDKEENFIKEKVNLLEAFCIHADLEPQMRRSITEELSQNAKHWAEKMSFDRQEVRTLMLSKLVPRSIIGKLPKLLYRGKLRKNMFLRCCSDVATMPPRLPCLLAVHFVSAGFQSGEIVFQLHDFAHNLGLVLSGTFAYVGQPSVEGGSDTMTLGTMVQQEEREEDTVDRQSSMWPSLQMPAKSARTKSEESLRNLAPYKLCGSENYFGEMECITGSMRLATVRCERSGTTLLLRKIDFFGLMDEFPQFGQVWASAAWRREQHRRNALKRLKAPFNCRHFAATTIQQAFRELLARASAPKGQRTVADASIARTKAMVVTAFQQKTKQYNHADLKEMTSAPPSISYVLREVEKLHHTVGSMQSDMKEMKEMLQALLPERTTHI